MQVDYIAFGPIFATATKEHPDPVAGLGELERCRDIVGRRPLVAIGGVDTTNVLEVYAAGASSAAVISAIVADALYIAENLKELLALTAA